ncbi:hypothetical protein RYX36_009432 [Vicia faba]
MQNCDMVGIDKNRFDSQLNNRLNHILPKPLPEPSVVLPVPALPPVSDTNATVTTSSTQAPSPMPYGLPPGSSLAKNDTRNPTVDKRKRK